MNLNLYKNFYKALFAASFIPMVIYSICCAVFYEQDVQYFASGAVLPTVFVTVAFIVSAVCIGASFTAKKGELSTKEPQNNLVSTFAMVFCAVIIGVYEVLDIISMLTSTRYTSNILYMYSEPSFVNKLFYDALNISRTIGFLFAMAAIAFFVLSAFSYKNKTAVVILQICLTVYLALNILSSYYDRSHPINSPIFTVDQIALVFFMYFNLCEIRYKLGIAAPRVGNCVGTIGFMFLATAGMGKIFGLIFGKMPMSQNIVFALFELAAAVYTASKVLPEIIKKPEIIPDPVFEEKPETTEEQ